MRNPRHRSRALLPLLAAAALLLASANAFAWSFAVCGDSHGDRKGTFAKILSEVDRSRMEFLLHTGDLGNSGRQSLWAGFRERAKGFSKPIRHVIGNHELGGQGSRAPFLRFFGLPSSNYSFDHRDAHFAILDTANGRLADDTLRWLEGDLAAHPKGTRGIRHLVVATHVPPRTDNIFPHGTDSGYGEASERLFAILKRHGVSLVLCSHEHMHFVDEWDGIRVIVSGGAGGTMFPFQPHGYYEIDLSGNEPRETFHAVSP